MPTITKCPECNGNILKSSGIGYQLEVCKNCGLTGFVNPDRKTEDKVRVENQRRINEYHDEIKKNG